MAGDTPIPGVISPSGILLGAGDTGNYEELKRRRAIATALASRNRAFPKTLGEGLTSFGQDIGDVLYDRRLQAMEAQQRATDRGGATSVPSESYRTGAGPAAAPAAVAAAPAAAVLPPAGPNGPYTEVPTRPVAEDDRRAPANLPAGLATEKALIGPGADAGDAVDPAVQRLKIARLLDPPPEVAGMVDPTVGGAQAPRGSRLASLETLSDAPPIGGPGSKFALSGYAPTQPPPPTGLTPRPMPDAAEENPPTPTDIAPRPVRTEVAQGPSGMIPGATAGVPGTPPAGAPGAPAGALPSELPMLGAKPQTMPDPGPEPVRPGRVGPSPAAAGYLRIMNDPKYSDEMRARAEKAYHDEEKFRLEIQSIQQETYKDKRERWQTLRDAKDKFDREAYDRNIDQSIKLHGLEDTRGKIYDAAFARGIPRQQALDKADAEIAEARQRIAKEEYRIANERPVAERTAAAQATKAEQEAAATETREINGVVYERTKAMPGVPASDWRLSPGGPNKEQKALTAEQAKTVKFLQRATVASSQLGDSSVLAGFKDTQAGRVPLTGNYWVSPEYQRAHSAAFTWLLSVLRDESGAAIGIEEAAKKYQAYFPLPGDSDQVIRDKAFRRKAEEGSLYDSLGTPDARGVIDKWRDERKGRKAETDPTTGKPFEEGTLRTNRATGVRQRVMGGHWENEEDLR